MLIWGFGVITAILINDFNILSNMKGEKYDIIRDTNFIKK